MQKFNGTARPHHGADLPIMIALSGFTQPATDFAQQHELIRRTPGTQAMDQRPAPLRRPRQPEHGAVRPHARGRADRTDPFRVRRPPSALMAQLRVPHPRRRPRHRQDTVLAGTARACRGGAGGY
ncbi:hypothetical protein ABTX80_31435 [Streptomyces erythrochromogenes]|uniref:hypothetical protein n=1 Tax=Streptomyces erythrochromogenes TaxID=285574 RepID=UPI0033266150